ncbi:MAG: signal peptidase I [Gammaproteobacteria bacterium]|nr:signal peptidase I [Gammaproteobacteria bacterium]
MARVYAAILLGLTLFTGLVWLFDRLYWSKQRALAGVNKEPVLVEYCRSFFPILLVILLLRSFVAEPFRIPSQSMLPTLERGDFILVSKNSYGIHMPAFEFEIMATGKPERGDVIVFRYPPDPRSDYIKRVIGLPGDTVTLHGYRIYINGEMVPQERVGEAFTPDGDPAILFEETIGDKRHLVYRMPNRVQHYERSYTVPAGHYFVMGDNRDNSNDSRIWGYVPEENLSGKAFFIWMNWDWDAGEWPAFDRIGNSVE